MSFFYIEKKISLLLKLGIGYGNSNEIIHDFSILCIFRTTCDWKHFKAIEHTKLNPIKNKMEKGSIFGRYWSPIAVLSV